MRTIFLIFPGQGKPLHEQLKDIIKLKITSGELKPGEALPSERQLMELYKLSRVTIRQAIGALVNEGLLYRKHGKGTFMAHPRIQQRPLARLSGLVEELQYDHHDVVIHIHHAGFIPVTAEIKKELELDSNENVFKVIRIITVANQPLCIDNRYYNATVGQIVQSLDLTKDSILTHLELYGFKISHGVQKISATCTNQESGKLLQCKIGSPLLLAKRTTFVEGNLPIDYSCAYYRADRYEYCIDLFRNQRFNREMFGEDY